MQSFYPSRSAAIWHWKLPTLRLRAFDIKVPAGKAVSFFAGTHPG
jgi:hypothetical protein